MTHLIQLLRTNNFELWLYNEPTKLQALIEARLFRIENHAHFGDAKHLGDGLSELRWKNGLRIYFTRTDLNTILLLHAGWKNEQKSDIKKARLLLERHTSI